MALREAIIFVTGTENPNPNAKVQFYNVHFNGTQIHTLVTFKPSKIKEWIKFIEWRYRKQRLIVGLGVQWHPNWKKKKNGASGKNPADTLQLCVENHCLIIQLTQAESVPEILRRFLENPSYTFVGIHNSLDVKKLKDTVHKLTLDSKLLFNLAGYTNTQPATITSMAVEFLDLGGVRNDPNIGMSDWNAKQLTKDQVQYACVDAHVSFLVAHKISI